MRWPMHAAGLGYVVYNLYNTWPCSPQIINAVLIIFSHLVPVHAGFDDSTSGGVTVASAADHLHENDHLGTAEELKSV